MEDKTLRRYLSNTNLYQDRLFPPQSLKADFSFLLLKNEQYETTC
jgi:hypothetical protein